MSNPNATYGFLCEFDSRNIYLFDSLRRHLHTVRNTYNPRELVLGRCYSARHMVIKEHHVEEKFRKNVKFHAHGSDVTAVTIATMPQNLPGLEKFQGKVWSQCLGFLRDPKNKFAETMCGGELGWVTVKYAPDGDTVFEIIDVAQDFTVNIPKEELLPTPWSPEYTEWVPRQYHPSTFVVHDKHRVLSQQQRFVKHSVCIETNISNAAYNPQNKKSSERCHHLFTTNLGMIRSVQPVQLGKWYQHEVLDNRRYNKMARSDREFYLSALATKLFEIEAPLPTKVVNGNVQIEVEFPFDHEVLESLENRRTIGWYQRTNGLKKDAHFCDQYLGKVEIYPRHAREIIQKVESYRRHLLEPFKSEPITVVGEVVRHRNAYQNNKKYPENGIFLVQRIIGIKDVKGRIINV
ncbi:hypothetical protein B9Z55_027290 [Caenorhabditis nigoni]|uniref:Uncharacterized protein n=1 Tax=Caenorhabditis nigoni TaxID=1611254 RepID=A0A2G5SHL3_9PELO|nr:hypothetical protein B9Z55_027290 [Caenorhabditis nigoni]